MSVPLPIRIDFVTIILARSKNMKLQFEYLSPAFSYTVAPSIRSGVISCKVLASLRRGVVCSSHNHQPGVSSFLVVLGRLLSQYKVKLVAGQVDVTVYGRTCDHKFGCHT
jgi:hypothetical protein